MLVQVPRRPYLCGMLHSARLASALLAVGLLATVPAAAQQKHAPAKAATSASPKKLGGFEDWTAATHQESGQLVCYAFTRAQNSTPVLPGRGEVVLTVTERPVGREAVALSAGYSYAPGAEVMMQVDQSGHTLYTSGRSAFAREGAAAVAAMQKGRGVVSRSPGPNKSQIVDSFSLKGFSQAYAAIVKACPAAK